MEIGFGVWRPESADAIGHSTVCSIWRFGRQARLQLTNSPLLAVVLPLEPGQKDMERRMGMAKGAVELRMPGLSNVRISGTIVFEVVPVVHLPEPRELKVLDEAQDHR